MNNNRQNPLYLSQPFQTRKQDINNNQNVNYSFYNINNGMSLQEQNNHYINPLYISQRVPEGINFN